MSIFNSVYGGPVYKREPGANTLVYLPLTAQTTTTDYGNLGFVWTQQGGNFVDNYYESTGAANVSRIYTGYNTYSSYQSYTVLFWAKQNTTTGYDYFNANNWGDGDNGNISVQQGAAYRRMGSGNGDMTFSSTADGNWHLYTLLGQSGVTYVDGVQVGSSSVNVQMKPRFIGINSNRINAGSGGGAFCISHLIIEDKIWTVQEILEYYNGTKSDYGV